MSALQRGHCSETPRRASSVDNLGQSSYLNRFSSSRSPHLCQPDRCQLLDGHKPARKAMDKHLSEDAKSVCLPAQPAPIQSTLRHKASISSIGAPSIRFAPRVDFRMQSIAHAR